MSPIRVWRAWTAPTTEGELAQRRESVLLNVLAILLVLVVFVVAQQFVLLVVSGTIGSFLRGTPFVVAAGVGFYWLLRAARRGRPRMAAIVVVVMFGLMLIYVLIYSGVANPMASLVIVLNVLLASMLLGVRASLVVLAFAAVAVMTAVSLDVSDTLRPIMPASDTNRAGPPDGLGVISVLAAIVWICWLYTRDALTSIDEVLTHGSEASPLRQLRTKTLSLREIEVVQLVAEGLSNDQIASRLFLSPRTVQSHVANAMKKTASANRTELGVLALREGLVPLEAAPDVETTVADRPAVAGR